MLINRSHFPWFFGVVVATIGAYLLYVANFHPSRAYFALPSMFGPVPPVRNTVGGTPLGLLFGVISYLIFLIAAGLGIRKKRRTWPIGHVQRWMKAHIWLTTLTIPLVLFHCGFHFGGVMTTTLMVLYGIVMVSGYYGLTLQQFMPGLMARKLPQEAVFEAIPHVRQELVQAAEKLWRELAPTVRKPTAGVHEAVEPHLQPGGSTASVVVAPMAEIDVDEDAGSRRALSSFLHDQVFPYLRAEKGRRYRLANPLTADSEFRSLKLSCAAKWHPQIEKMEQWVYDRRNLDAQTRMQHWLHVWLLVHVPLSLVLLVFTFWHAYVTIIYM